MSERSRMAAEDMNADLVRHLLDYEPESGILRWRVRAHRNAQVGDVAGTFAQGYLNVAYRGRAFRAHRLIWLHVHGEWPQGEIDHIDCNKLNNRIENLRDTTRALNAQNMTRAYRVSKTGLRGSWLVRGGKFTSQITLYGRKHELGRFATAIGAHNAYMEAKRAAALNRTTTRNPAS